jgi:predicted SnoaL-like aldol condensation-catalyzing enzyme
MPEKEKEKRLMTDKELEAAASGLLDTAFNAGELETAVTEHLGDKFVQHNPTGSAKSFVIRVS